MRKKLALIAVLAVAAASLIGAQSASAAYLSVKATPTEFIVCKPADNAIGMYIGIKAKVKAKGITKPSNIRIGYQILSTDSKQVIKSGVVNLKRSKGYKGETAAFAAYLGESLTYHLNMSYKADGRTLKSKRSYYSVAPTQAELDQLGVSACPT